MLCRTFPFALHDAPRNFPNYFFFRNSALFCGSFPKCSDFCSAPMEHRPLQAAQVGMEEGKSPFAVSHPGAIPMESGSAPSQEWLWWSRVAPWMAGSPTSSVGIVPVAELGRSRRSISATSKLLLAKRRCPSAALSRTMGQAGLSWDLSAHPWRLCRSEQRIPSSPLDPGICHCHAKSWVWDVIHTSSPSLIHQRQLSGNTGSAGSGCGS